MHYFKMNIGDYAKKAGRLSMIEHGAYTLLIHACYDREKFPSLEDAYDWCWVRTDEEKLAVEFVLKKFFYLEDGVYVQNRIREEIEKYHENAETNKRIATEREEKRKGKARSVHEACESVNEPPPNQEPLTTNHKPLNINQETLKEKINKKEIDDVSPSAQPKKNTGTRLPENFEMPEDWIQWARDERSDLDAKAIITERDKFVDYWHSVAGAKARKTNWLATWRNWVRGCRAQPPPSTIQQNKKFNPMDCINGGDGYGNKRDTSRTFDIEGEVVGENEQRKIGYRAPF